MKIRYFSLYILFQLNICLAEHFLVDPKDLITPSRFDVMAKYIYAKHYKLNTNCTWATELYKEHLKNWNGFKENLPEKYFPHFHCTKEYVAKNNFYDFLTYFNKLIESISNNGFLEEKSVLPIQHDFSIIDGSHRLGIALAYNIPVIAESISHTNNIKYDAEFFAKIGLDEKYIDAMALEYARLKKNTYIVTIFPTAKEKRNQSINILKQYGEIIYHKKIYLCKQGAFNFIKLLYEEENWIGTQQNSFAGIKGKMNPCFPNNEGEVDILLYHCNNTALTQKAKNIIRSMFNVGNHSIHINDTHQETVQLAEILFNMNGLHWLNNAILNFCPQFEKYLKQYKNFIKNNAIDPECVCIDGSAIMALYGIRDCHDLDILHRNEYNNLFMTDSTISSHNHELKYHHFHMENILFNPQNHFWYKGVKFVSLPVLYAMKRKRNEEKDRADCERIKKVLPYESI